MSALEHPPDDVGIERTLGTVEITLPGQPTPGWMLNGAVLLMTISVCLWGLSLSLIGPHLTAMLPSTVPVELASAGLLASGVLLLAELIVVAQWISAHPERTREVLTLTADGVVFERRGRSWRRAWSEVLAYAPEQGILDSDAVFVPAGRHQEERIQRWLGEVIEEARHSRQRGSAREVPAALRQLRDTERGR